MVFLTSELCIHIFCSEGPVAIGYYCCVEIVTPLHSHLVLGLQRDLMKLVLRKRLPLCRMSTQFEQCLELVAVLLFEAGLVSAHAHPGLEFQRWIGRASGLQSGLINWVWGQTRTWMQCPSMLLRMPQGFLLEGVCGEQVGACARGYWFHHQCVCPVWQSLCLRPDLQYWIDQDP